MLYFKLYPLILLMQSHIVSYSYLCIWVNRCSIISQVIIFLKVLKLIVSVSILNPALLCSTPRVALLVVDLSRLSQSFLLCVAQHLELLCSFSTCLRPSVNLSCFVLLNTSIRSARCSVVSGSFLNTLTFVGPVLVSYSPLWRSNLLLLMFHSRELLQYFDQ